MAPKTIGPKKVPMRNHLLRTRSRYSRSTTAQSLPLTTQSLLDAAGADPMQEDLVQRRLHELEAADLRARGYQPLQEQLGRRTGRQLDLEEAVLVVHAAHERRVGEDAGRPACLAVGQSDRDVSLAMAAADVADRPVEHLLAAGDDADRVAHALRVVHHVRAEDD